MMQPCALQMDPLGDSALPAPCYCAFFAEYPALVPLLRAMTDKQLQALIALLKESLPTVETVTFWVLLPPLWYGWITPLIA